MKSSMEDPIGLAEQCDQFLGPDFYPWDEMMSILSMLINREERGMTRQAAMQEWQKMHPPGPEPVPAGVLQP